MGTKATGLIMLTIKLVLLIGWIKCVINFVNCDFKAPYKAEILYGVGTFTPLGGIIGYIDLGE